jgi:hypothetical protein
VIVRQKTGLPAAEPWMTYYVKVSAEIVAVVGDAASIGECAVGF